MEKQNAILYLLIAVAAFILYFKYQFSTSTYYFNWLFSAEAIVGALGGKPGDNGDDLEKNPCGACGSFTACATVLILAGFLGF